LREELRQKMFENRVLRRTFWPERDEWRKLHNEELKGICTAHTILLG